VSNELDTAAAGSLGGFLKWRRRTGHELPPGAACANCGTPLQGPWCHECGQLGEDFHRSASKLVVETIEGLFHFDGRLWRTLPALARSPGRLTRDYLDGHRAPQIPPLRLFLVVLLLVFVVGSLPGKKFSPINIGVVEKNGSVSGLESLTPEQRALAKKQLSKVKVQVGGDKPNEAASHWLRDRLQKVVDEPERFFLVLESWGERFAFLMLPLSTLLLAAAFVHRRQFFLFDHVIFSLHSLSFMGMLLSLALVLPDALAGLLFLIAPVHLFVHLRGVYRTSIVGTLLRMLWLFIGTVFGVVFIVLGLVAVGLNAMA
jgi:hypothetical protein